MLTGKIQQVLTEEDKKELVKQKLEIMQRQLERLQNYKTNKIYPTIESCIIPFHIYQTWHSKTLPQGMYDNLQKLINMHPRFQHHLFDDDDCREFIRTNFKPDVVDAFDKLIPGAYKADLWRYCVLFINGGIYMDIKYNCVNTFRLFELTDKEHFVLDINKIDIYNALIAVKPKNLILFKCIRKIVENVQNKFYGHSCLSPTGPQLLSTFFSKEDYSNLNLEHIVDRRNGSKLILFNDIPVLKMYNGYYREQDNFKKVQHYGVLWNQRKVYA